VYSIAATYLIIVGLPTQMYLKATATPHDKVITRTEWTPTQPTLPHGTLVQTGATETKEIPLKGGSTVVLRPNSRFTYEYIPGPFGVMAVLDGEAAINLSERDVRMMLKSSAGSVLMNPGSYAVRCVPSCTGMLVTVGSGLALIRHDSVKKGLQLNAGEKGMLPKAGEPEKVAPGKDWPVLEPAKPAEGGRGGAGAAGSTAAKRHG
jgi:ferric-dicitrate binding protein FerR (iron transport regulator)